MKKKCFLSILFAGIILSVFSQQNTSKNIMLEIHGVTPNVGKLYGGVYFSSQTYRIKIPDILLEYEPMGTIVIQNITLPLGECLINFYQDLDNNGECNVGLFGMPKEPVGIVNWNGKGIPGNFNKLRLLVTETTDKIVVVLYNV